MYKEKKRGIHDIPDTKWIVDSSDPDQVSNAESYTSKFHFSSAVTVASD